MFDEVQDMSRKQVGKNKSDMMKLNLLESHADGRESVVTPAFKCRMNSNLYREQQKGAQNQLNSSFNLDSFPKVQLLASNNKREEILKKIRRN